MDEKIDEILSHYFSEEATKNSGYIDTEKALVQFQAYMYGKQKKSYNVFLKTSIFWKAAAAIVLLVMASFTFYYLLQPSKTIQLMAVETQKEYTLFENADVTLFPGAEIVYHKKSSHQIQLKGKAAFNIQSEHSKKLVIQAGETYIEDIGTVFSIDATTPDQSITVEVTAGEVWFYTDKNSGVHLKANESAVYDAKIKQFKMIEAFIEELIENELIFHDTPLYEAIELIKSRYNVDIVVSSNALNDIQLNASFDNNESVEYVLDIITATLSAHLSKKNDTYIITF